MKKTLTIFALLTIVLMIACNDQKTTNTSNDDTTSKTMKANLIDGTWEVNYMMNLPKPLNEMYPEAKPTITFSSDKNTANGFTGCNNFNGKFSIDGQKLAFDEKMATTRKMCPNIDAEQIFLETLAKVNSYSVSEKGNTLNLIMGDIGVMRLNRK